MKTKIDLSQYNKTELVIALLCVQHHCPPRPTRQGIGVLRNCARIALASEHYGKHMRQALTMARKISKVKGFR